MGRIRLAKLGEPLGMLLARRFGGFLACFGHAMPSFMVNSCLLFSWLVDFDFLHFSLLMEPNAKPHSLVQCLSLIGNVVTLSAMLL